jgi:tetratricopeptide (TPR) repeat protein
MPAVSLEQALSLLDRGDEAGARALLEQQLAAALASAGPQSLAAAAAHNALGSFARLVGDDEAAAGAFCRAVDIATSLDAQKEELTYLLNLGDVLERSGSLHHAEDAVRRSLQGRRELYGPAHPGYAFALEPLAQVLLRQGKHDAALEAAEEAVANFRHHRHPRQGTALALRAEVRAALGGAELWGPLAELPEETLAAAAQAALSRLESGSAERMAPALLSLLEVLEARLGLDHFVPLALWSGLANVAAEGAPVPGRLTAIERVRAAHERRGELAGIIEATLALALAHHDAGDDEAREACFEEALGRAGGAPALVAEVERARGALLDVSGAHEDALPFLRAAVEAARRAGEAPLLGRCLAALGAAAVHAGERGEPTSALLTEARALLGAGDENELFARAHEEALASGRPCGCGEQDPALLTALRELVLAQLPAGLADDVQFGVTGEDEGLAIEVLLKKEPSPSEQRLLDEVVKAAHRRLREKALAGR